MAVSYGAGGGIVKWIGLNEMSPISLRLLITWSPVPRKFVSLRRCGTAEEACHWKQAPGS